jgi:Ser/Thr protein kinase RdoA (MazF antagonist)
MATDRGPATPTIEDVAEALGAYGRRPVGPPEPVEYSVRNQNYRVPTDRGPLFVRFHRPNRAIERLRREHRAIDWAAAQRLPVVRPLRSLDGQTLVPAAGRIVAVFPWVAGRSPRRGQLTVGQAAALGDMHGRLHAVLAGYADPELPWFWASWPSDGLNALAQLERCAAELPNAELTEDERRVVGACLEAQLAHLRAEGEGAPPAPDWPGAQPVHGDYHERNVLLDEGDAIAAVVDWDMVTRMPRGFEVVRCLTYAGLLDQPRLEAYLTAYGQHTRLMPSECLAAVELWWRFNVAQSWLYRTRLIERDPAVQQFFPEHRELLARFGDRTFRAALGDELRRLAGADG